MAAKKTTTKKASSKTAAAKRPTKRKAAQPKAAKKASAKPADAAAGNGAKPAKRTAKKADKPAGEKKVSCIDAAAQVLAASKTSMTTKEMIDAMGAQGLWTSPGGKTPHATLYSAILREINVKGKEARFKKTDRGHFAANG